MTEEAIFIDSSVFLMFFIDGVNVFDKLEGKLLTSVNVIEEVTYVLTKERAKDLKGVDRHYDLLNYLRENPNFVSEISEEVISDITDVLNFYDISVLPPANYSTMFEIVKSYGLLPNDALIVATCKHYGIKKIATFDEDFKRVNFIEVLEVKNV